MGIMMREKLIKDLILQQTGGLVFIHHASVSLETYKELDYN
jgi:hypothetical protein